MSVVFLYNGFQNQSSHVPFFLHNTANIQSSERWH